MVLRLREYFSDIYIVAAGGLGRGGDIGWRGAMVDLVIVMEDNG